MTASGAFGSVEVQALVFRGLDPSGVPLAPVTITGTVPEPTVGIAVAVLTGDEGEALAAARAWLPPVLYSDVRALSAEPRRAMLAYLIADASGADMATPEASGESGREADPDALHRATLDVAAALGSYRAVMEMPWRAFLRMGERLRARKAEEALDMATAARVGFNADAKGFESYRKALVKLAAPPKPKREEDEETREATRRAADAQSAMIRAQLERRRRTGSALPQTEDEREAHNAHLAAMQAALSPEGEA